MNTDMEYQTELLDLRCTDCMELMRGMPDKAFDLAIVDPPYGIEQGKNAAPSRVGKKAKNGQGWNDSKPTPEYFKELFRVSKNQIVWGFNHLSDMLPPCKEFIFWFKHQPVDTYSDGELAWTSFTKTAKCADIPYFGFTGKDIVRMHPAQKPLTLYNWLLHNYARPGDRILDTHLGSASSAIACHYKGFHLTGTELDLEYFAAAVDRVKRETAQQELVF